jgi:uncharacterized membrane protein
MCCKKYKLSTCSLNTLIFGFLILLISLTGLSDKSKDKIIGELNLKETSIIIFIIGLCIVIISFFTLCRKDINYTTL